MSSELKWYGAEVVKKIRQATETGLVACAIHTQGQVKELVPVKTGRLKNSISYKTKTDSKGDLKTNALEGEAIIGTNVEYGIFVELGTARQKPKSYLRAGLDVVKNDLFEIYKKEYDRVMK